jgi:hypothetical protein
VDDLVSPGTLRVRQAFGAHRATSAVPERRLEGSAPFGKEGFDRDASTRGALSPRLLGEGGGIDAEEVGDVEQQWRVERSGRRCYSHADDRTDKV